MPAKRGKNAAKKQAEQKKSKRGASGSSGSRFAALEAPETAHDIIGVVLAVLSLVLFIATLSNSDAVVTGFIRTTFYLAFGRMALVFPIILFVCSITFFFEINYIRRLQFAIGFLLVLLSVCGLLSLNMLAGSAAPDRVFSIKFLQSAGGYCGGGLAWISLVLFGRGVGNAILCGLIIIAFVICGFSVSAAINSIRTHASSAYRKSKDKRQKKREQKIIDAAGDYSRSDGAKKPLTSQSSQINTTNTSNLSSQKTTVLEKRKGTKRSTTTNRNATSTPRLIPIPSAKTSQNNTGDVASFDSALTKKIDKSDTQHKVSNTSLESKTANILPTRPGEDAKDYKLPPLNLLSVQSKRNVKRPDDSDYVELAQKLQDTLEEFDLLAKVEGWTVGPSVTTFKISMGVGERVNKIVNLEGDIALSLAAKSVRIFAPIPGTSLVGIEIPNKNPQSVLISDVLPKIQGGPLATAFGIDSEGNPIIVDLAGLPHLLVAGTTGSGKSVLLNAIIMSMLMRATPKQVRLIMVDPKRVEFTAYSGLPHLYVPVVTEPKQAASALQWGVTEMERRLKVFEHYKVRDIASFNKNVDLGKYNDLEKPPAHVPYFVIVIDELADLMLVAGKDVESSIVRIAQLGRAAGIHLIVATQRPSADVVTGLIRANIDNRVALSVDNSLNSRIILDQKGAEQLLGKGDMLVKLRGKKPRRAQGCWVSDHEIESVVSFVKSQTDVDYHEDILTAASPLAPKDSDIGSQKSSDPLLWEAAQIVIDLGFGSTSGLQRALSVGYARAGRIMDMLETKGVVGPANGSKPREVLMDKDALEELRLHDVGGEEELV